MDEKSTLRDSQIYPYASKSTGYVCNFGQQSPRRRMKHEVTQSDKLCIHRQSPDPRHESIGMNPMFVHHSQSAHTCTEAKPAACRAHLALSAVPRGAAASARCTSYRAATNSYNTAAALTQGSCSGCSTRYTSAVPRSFEPVRGSAPS